MFHIKIVGKHFIPGSKCIPGSTKKIADKFVVRVI